MSCTECIKFEKKIAFHLAPSLLGIKCANLISLNQTEFNIPEHLKHFNAKASVKGLKMKLLCTCNERALILLYNESLLKQQLKEKTSIEILEKYGYPELTQPEEALCYLSERIRTSGQFPHEIGVFLGYPADDIIGFIENKGENYMLCGYWKVYSNAERARRIFANYDKCRKFLCNKLNQGCNIYQALKIS